MAANFSPPRLPLPLALLPLFLAALLGGSRTALAEPVQASADLAEEVVELSRLHHLHGGHASKSEDEDEDEEEEEEKPEGVEAFQQCDGNGMTKKCQPGCLCVAKNEFFSGCKPSPGETHCNAKAAKGHLNRVKHRAAPLIKKKAETAKNKEEKIRAFEAAAREAASLNLKAASALSEKAVKDEAATMHSVEEDNADKIKEEVANLKKAELAENHTKKVAEKEAHKPVLKAEEALWAAKKRLEDVKKASAKDTEEVVVEQAKFVKEAKAKMAKGLSTSLGPVLEERKKKAAAASKRAAETAAAEVRAKKAKIAAKEAMDKAAKDAAAAAKELEPAEKKVKHWAAALK